MGNNAGVSNMSEWYLDAVAKTKEELEDFADGLTFDGWETKIEQIDNVEGAYWGFYRRKIE